MVEYMDGIRELRLANDRRLFVDGRREATAFLWSRWLAEGPHLKRYPPGYFLPTVVDVLEHPRTQSFINEPGERLFEKEEFTAFFDNFHDAIEEWRRDKVMDTYIPVSQSNPYPGSSPFKHDVHPSPIQDVRPVPAYPPTPSCYTFSAATRYSKSIPFRRLHPNLDAPTQSRHW